jgi:energy-converting hydrogenase Eha subunit G
MPDQRYSHQDIDIRFLTPLLLMALIVVVGILLYAYTGHSLAATG